MAAWTIAKLRVGWMFAGCAPGVFTIDSRTLFQSITGCPDSWPGRRLLTGAFVLAVLARCVVLAWALPARTTAATTAASAIPSADSDRGRRFIPVLLF